MATAATEHQKYGAGQMALNGAAASSSAVPREGMAPRVHADPADSLAGSLAGSLAWPARPPAPAPVYGTGPGMINGLQAEPPAPPEQGPKKLPSKKLPSMFKPRSAPAQEGAGRKRLFSSRQSSDGLKRPWKTRFFQKLASAPAIFVLATIVAPGLLIGARFGLVEQVPATAKLYAAIGLPVNLDGLDLRNVTSVLKSEDGSKHLLIKGEIINLRSRTSQLPNLQLALRGKDGRDIYNWQAPSPTKRIKAHEALSFVARLDSPPEGAADVLVLFARKGS